LGRRRVDERRQITATLEFLSKTSSRCRRPCEVGMEGFVDEEEDRNG
jgi:hypothetical protein